MRLALLAWVASAHDCSSLLQAKHREKQEEQAGAWRTPRDLAVNQDVKLFFAGGQELIVFSAVPSFDGHRSEIAVMVDNLPGVQELLKRKPVFCSERGRHPSQVTLAGLRGPSEPHMALNSSMLLQKGSKYLVLRCPWPADEANREVFEVTVEQGPHQLGTVLARHNPSLLKNYGTVACVRELFVQTKELSNSPLRLLPQWLEWHRMKGVEHFLFYTFNQTISSEFKAIMEPFIKEGFASRVHFENYPPFHRNRHWRVIADCLPRVRGHAKWLLPSFDLDEYLVLSPELFQSDSLPEDYMNSAWDSIARFYGKRPEEVSSISFDGFRFEPPAPSGAAVLDITSTLREGILQKTPYQHGLHEGPGWRKHVVNVENTETTFVHWAVETKNGTTALDLLSNMGHLNHYRVVPSDFAWPEDKKPANVTDESLLLDVPKLKELIELDYQETVSSLLSRLDRVTFQTDPTPGQLDV